MAQEHQLKLKAVLDTSDVQNKLNQLNRQQGGSSPTSSPTGQSGLGNVATGINNVLMRLNNSITQLNQSIVRLTNATRVPAQTTQHSPNNTFIPPTGKLGQSISNFRENAVREYFQKNQNLSRREFERTVANSGYRVQSFLREQFGPNWAREATIYRRTPTGEKWISGKSDYDMDPLYKRTMKYVLGGHVLGQFANLGQQHADLYGNSGVSRGLGALQNMAQTAAFGAMLGPWGALAGGAIGLGQSYYENYISGIKEQKQAEEQRVYDVIQNAGIKRKYNTARANFTQDQSIYAAMKSSNVDSLQSIRDSLIMKQQNAEAGLRALDRRDTIDPTIASDLQTTLASTLSKIHAIDQAIETIKKHKEEEARLSERINKGIQDSSIAMSRYDESRVNGRFYSENIADYKMYADMYGSTARQNKSEYHRLLELAYSETDNEKKQKILQQASDVRSSWQFSLGQADSFQQGYISKLQELLSRLVAPDISPVTSLASIGRDAGASDNMQRQQRFYDESLNLQREIRDAIDKGVSTYD